VGLDDAWLAYMIWNKTLLFRLISPGPFTPLNQLSWRTENIIYIPHDEGASHVIADGIWQRTDAASNNARSVRHESDNDIDEHVFPLLCIGTLVSW
jgi:hypothetical protein